MPRVCTEVLFMFFARLVISFVSEESRSSELVFHPLISSFLMSRRSQSFRQGPLHTSKRSQSQNAVNTSISAHPLLPIETGWYYLYKFFIWFFMISAEVLFECHQIASMRH